jgi:hypothetical protein
MELGLSHDVMRRWTGNATSVVAQRASFVPQRPLTPGGPIVDNPNPDAVTVLAETTGGASAINMLNYAVYHGESRIERFHRSLIIRGAWRRSSFNSFAAKSTSRVSPFTMAS